MAVVTSTTCSATNDGVPVTTLPTTGFSLTSVNLVGTGAISGLEQAILIEGVDLQGIIDSVARLSTVSVATAANTSSVSVLNAGLSTVSVIAASNSRVPVAAHWPASVGADQLVARFATPVNIVTQTSNHYGFVSTSVSTTGVMQFFAGDTTGTTKFAEMSFSGGRTATVSITTSTIVSAGKFIEVRSPSSVGEQLQDFSFTLFVRRF